MLRAVSVLYGESQSLLLLCSVRRDAYKLFRTNAYAAASTSQTVLSSEASQPSQSTNIQTPPPQSTPPPPPPSPPPRRSWTVAAALALTASVGGIYFFRKLSDDDDKKIIPAEETQKKTKPVRTPIPATADQFPKHVQYLLVGAGTASFAAMRAIRSQKPDAQVLIVGSEYQLPYMRPPLTKELWREPDLDKVTELDSLTFRQWNGKVRSLAYEPNAFYTPVGELGPRGAGCGVARGWTVGRLDVSSREAHLHSDQHTHTLTYDYCLIATGVRPRRAAGLAGARAGDRVRAVRTGEDAVSLARVLADPAVQRVAVVGGGVTGTELSAALAVRLKESGKTVVELFRESAPLAGTLPPYLQGDAARRLRDVGVTLLPEADVVDSRVVDEKVVLVLASGAEVQVDYVVECVGTEFDPGLALASDLEVHPELGGIVVNAELQARHRVWAGGSAACHWSPTAGRGRAGGHELAVTAGRRAGSNMVADTPAIYTQPHMFWTDLGPDLGYEAIGKIDSKLQTVGVFSADAVSDVTRHAHTDTSTHAHTHTDTPLTEHETETEQHKTETEQHKTETAENSEAIVRYSGGEAGGRGYERGVVFYVEGRRVVGVLLWNLFNRMHIARQVLAQGEFEDLFEVAKLFNLHEDE